MLGLADIQQRLHHRDPFLFVSSVTSLSDFDIEATFQLRQSHPVFKGHFPGNPIMPGVLCIESLAQVSGLCVISSVLKEKSWQMKDVVYESFLVKVDAFKFKSKIVPDVDMVIKSKITPLSMDHFYEAKGQIFVDDKLMGYGGVTLYVHIKNNKEE